VRPFESGVYELSPDGTVLAMLGFDERELLVVDVASGEAVQVEGPGREAGPAWAASWPESIVWSPDSQWLLCAVASLPDTSVWLVDRDGSDAEKLGQGGAPIAFFDARSYGYVRGRHGSSPAGVTMFGADPDPLVAPAAVHEMTTHEWVVYYIALEDGWANSIRAGDVGDLEGSELVGPPDMPGHVVGYRDVLVSADGLWLAYNEMGDDGYSRLYAVRTDGTGRRELSIRRDAYPLRWSSDSEYLLFIEGNAFQGEDTDLMRVRPDGTGRQLLVEGAGL
jgi:Tol biopolymer transport system component